MEKGKPCQGAPQPQDTVRSTMTGRKRERERESHQAGEKGEEPAPWAAHTPTLPTPPLLPLLLLLRLSLLLRPPLLLRLPLLLAPASPHRQDHAAGLAIPAPN